MNARQFGFGLLLLGFLASAAAAPALLDWLRGSDGILQPAEAAQAIALAAGLVGFGALLVGPLVATQIKAAARPTAADLVAQLKSCAGDCPELFDALVLGTLKRQHAALRAELDVVYADVKAERMATVKRLDDLANGIGALSKLPTTMDALNQNVAKLSAGVEGLSRVVDDVKRQGDNHARAIAETREELAAYAGPERRGAGGNRRRPAA